MQNSRYLTRATPHKLHYVGFAVLGKDANRRRAEPSGGLCAVLHKSIFIAFLIDMYSSTFAGESRIEIVEKMK